MTKESINKITLLGIARDVQVEKVGNTTSARFTVCTERCYKGKDGQAVVESTAVPVTAFGGKCTADIDRLKDGDAVLVLGRLRIFSLGSVLVETKTGFSVLANALAIVDAKVVPENIEP